MLLQKCVMSHCYAQATELIMGPKNLVADCAKFIVIAHAWGIIGYRIHQLLRAQSRAIPTMYGPQYDQNVFEVVLSLFLYSSNKIRKPQNEHLNIFCQNLNGQ